MSDNLLEDDTTPEVLFETAKDPEKLKQFPGFQKALAMGVAKAMSFQYDLDHVEIKGLVKRELDGIIGKVPKEVLEEQQVTTEHVGSTSIPGMPGTPFPDALILYKDVMPEAVFMAILKSGYTFIGAGPHDPTDLWFLKKITAEMLTKEVENLLNGALIKIHFTPRDLGASKILLETRDRCNSNPADYQSYKESKIAAAEFLKEGNIMGYKGAKLKCSLMVELMAKHCPKKE